MKRWIASVVGFTGECSDTHEILNLWGICCGFGSTTGNIRLRHTFCVNYWHAPLFCKNCRCPCAPFLTCLTFPVWILKIISKLILQPWNILVNFDIWMSIRKCYWLSTPLSFIFFSLNKIYSVHECYIKAAFPPFLHLFLQIIYLWLAKQVRTLNVC